MILLQFRTLAAWQMSATSGKYLQNPDKKVPFLAQLKVLFRF